MTSEQFVYWLQGYMEMSNPSSLGIRETRIIKDHLALVFNKKTPEREEEKGLDLVFDFPNFPLQKFPGITDGDILDKKFCSPSDYSYSTTPICLEWNSSNTLPKKRVKEDMKNKKSQIKC